MLNIISSLKDYLISKLISSGVEVYEAKNNDNAKGIISKIPINVILVDVDSKSINFLEFMKEIRSIEGGERIRSIILLKMIDKGVITKYIQYGLIGFLPKNLELEEYGKKIIKFIDSHLYTNERRQNVRIIPDEEDKVLISLPITGKTNEKLDSEVIDLSIQGVAFKFSNPDYKNYYRLNQELNQAELHIGGRRYLTEIKLVRVGDISVAIYITPKETFINSIAKFIFEKLKEQYNS